jgi:hypothetical protein
MPLPKVAFLCLANKGPLHLRVRTCPRLDLTSAHLPQAEPNSCALVDRERLCPICRANEA